MSGRPHCRFWPGVILAVFLLSACGGGDPSSTTQTPAGVVCDRSLSEVQDLVAEIVDEVPGFAGCAPDPENAGGYVLNVTTGPVGIEAIRAAIIAHDPASEGGLGDAALRPHVIDVSQISVWYRDIPPRLITVAPSADYRWFSSDQDEVNDQIILTYAGEEARAWAQDWILRESGTPPGAIVAVIGDPGQVD